MFFYLVGMFVQVDDHDDVLKTAKEQYKGIE